MYINIPFELNDPVYIIANILHCYKKWVPPDYSLGGDVDGPYDRGHYKNYYTYTKEVKKVKFHFALLDKYKIEEIFSNEEDAYWNLLLQLQKEKKFN